MEYYVDQDFVVGSGSWQDVYNFTIVHLSKIRHEQYRIFPGVKNKRLLHLIDDPGSVLWTTF